MISDPRQWIRALRQSHDDLAAMTERIGSRLQDPSYCSDWSISQVLSHLGSGAEIALRGLERGLAGQPPLTPDDFPAVWDRWNGYSPQEQAYHAIAWDRRHVSVLEGLTDKQLNGMELSLMGMQLDALGIVGLRLGEHAVHRWDIAVAESAEAELLPSAVELLIDRAPMMAGWVGQAGHAGGPRTIGVRTSDPERRYLLSISDTVKMSDWTDELRNGLLELPAFALIRLIYGRLDPDHTPEGIRAEGSADVDELRKVFPGF